MEIPPTPSGAQVCPWQPEAESGSLGSRWIRRGSGTNAPPRFTLSFHMAKCRGRSNWLSCFHIKRQTIYLYLHPTGPSTCLAAHACVSKGFEWCVWGTKKRDCLMWWYWGTAATEEEEQERCSWVLKLMDQMGFNVNLNMAQLKQPCPDSGTGETRRGISARKVKLSVK